MAHQTQLIRLGSSDLDPDLHQTLGSSDIAIEDNALLFQVDVEIVEPISMHALQENKTAATTIGRDDANTEGKEPFYRVYKGGGSKTLYSRIYSEALISHCRLSLRRS